MDLKTRQAERLANETSEQFQLRLMDLKTRQAERLANETPEQFQLRLMELKTRFTKGSKLAQQPPLRLFYFLVRHAFWRLEPKY
jgi:hypothetical protein